MQLEQLKVQEMVRLQEDMVDEFLNDDDLEMDENGGVTSKHMKLLENLFGKFEGYYKVLAVFGFNSAGYDVKLSRSFCLKNCVNPSSNQISQSKRLESIHASRLNT